PANIYFFFQAEDGIRDRVEPTPSRGRQGGSTARMKIAVIGLGSIGRRHLGNFHTIGVEALQAYDATETQRNAAGAQFPYARITPTLEAALDGAAGVVVCTPPSSHLEIARLAAPRGAHLMIE